MIKKGYLVSAAFILLVFFVFFGSISNLDTTGDEDFPLELNNKSENLPEGFSENQREANMILNQFYMHLMQSCGTTYDDAVYTVNGLRAENFPPYFAGAYINTEGRLIVQITDKYYTKNYKRTKWYKEFVEIVENENFYCHPVKYSYSELITALSNVTLGDLAEELSARGVKIVAAGIDDYGNTIHVHVKGQEAYDIVMNILDSDIYTVSSVDSIPQDDIGLAPGEGATTSSSGVGSLSVACRVRRNNPDGTYTYGFLSCAHVFSGTTKNVYVQNGGTFSSVGICYSFNQHLGGSADVSFIGTNSNVTLNDTIYSTSTTLYHSYSNNYAQGSLVYKRGTKTGVTSGVISCNSFYNTVDNVLFTDMVLATYSRDGGDSGGIVYDEPDATNHAYPIGIHKGGYNGNGYFTKMYNGLSALQSGVLTYSLY
ncbi:MAG: hypothetical protein E7295_00650 [Lachnospiraceae bacterium]|jgi:hypothetical protein|nr:hypothetical protein [Lachnospiraceae bacterium]